MKKQEIQKSHYLFKNKKEKAKMTEQVKVDLVLDLKGLLCPMPIVKLSQAIKDLPVGAVIEGIATDPGVMADVPAWAKTSGQELISIEQRDKEYRFLIKKVK
ncbi:sulfurtransferase TusA family protein [Candidatus Kryptonium thompsonii]|nr:sulfurtransferase TusA family protein [Candidatus Kryptonium thompsoni]